MNEHEIYKADWAGYDMHGMDRMGHFHPHPDGCDYHPSKGARGFFCASPVDLEGKCIDPRIELFEAFGAHRGMYDHKCGNWSCENIVAYDDEPFCFTHSPDSGSYMPGYSARMRAVQAAQLRRDGLEEEIPF